jgi:hypothetical protein
MSIIVFWLDESGVPAHQPFEPNELTLALQCSEARRREGKRHVCISSELADSVGKPGVTAVEGRALPDGSAYEWSKAHRGAGPSSKA